MSRRSLLKVLGISTLALAIGMNANPAPAWASHAKTPYPMPTEGIANDLVNGKQVVKGWAPGTLSFLPEILGLNQTVYDADEAQNSFNNARGDTELLDGVQTASTIGLFGTAVNKAPNPYLVNYLYRTVKGGTTEEAFTANVDYTFQGAAQFAALDDSMGGIPGFMYHRPDVYYAAEGTATAGSKSLADYVEVIRGFKPEDAYYQTGDEGYDPLFFDVEAATGVSRAKFQHVTTTWLAANAAMQYVDAGSRSFRYEESPVDMAARFEQLMLASQYAVLRAIATGQTTRKRIAVIGGISDQYNGVANGVNTATGRARSDPFMPSEVDFSKYTCWGSMTGTNVRYYQAAAALENISDSIVDVMGFVESSWEDASIQAPVLKDADGIFWVRPEALMACSSIVIRGNTNVSTIPGTEELYQILREAGFENEDEWPDVFTTAPLIPGYGAANAGAYFWKMAYMSFVYPEVLNPAHLAAYICSEIYHVNNEYLSDVVNKLYGEMSLPAGYQLDISQYTPEAVQALLDAGVEWYLVNKAAVDERYPNLVMTPWMQEYLTPAKKEEMGIGKVVRAAGENRYGTMSAAVLSAFATSDTVVVASGENYPDALAASGLAGVLDAPVITVRPDGLPPETESLIHTLGATKAVIIGGTAAVSDDVAMQLIALGMDEPEAVKRIAGASRVETANYVFAATEDWGDTAIVAFGNNFPDALSASALAFMDKAPIFLTTPDGVLDDATLANVKGFKKAYIVGGSAVVDPSVDDQLKAAGVEVKRLAGDNRYETSAAIAQQVVEDGGSLADVGFATGNNFADALAGGIAMGKRGGVILLVSDDNTGAATGALSGVDVGAALVFGGSAAVSDSAFDTLEQAI